MPVHIQEPERLRLGPGVVAGQCHDQVFRLACGGQLGELAADRLDLRGPVQAQHPAQRARRDAGGSLRPRLPQQGEEHQGEQCCVEAVEPVPELPVYGAGAGQQPRGLQRRQRQQQPGQRVARPRREHRRGGLTEQPPPGERPLPGAGHGVWQHRQPSLLLTRRDPGRAGVLALPGARGLTRLLLTSRRLGFLSCGGGSSPARAAPQGVADAGHRHPRHRRDLGQGLAGRVQPADPRHHLRGQPRRPLRPLARRDQPGHPTLGQRLVPPPHGDRVHPERLRDLRLAGRPQPHQLHRGQPPARLIPGVPGEGGQPMHQHQPARLAGHHTHPRGDLSRAGEQQRERQLGQHRGHYPPSSSPSDTASIFADQRHGDTHRHTRNCRSQPL